MNDEIKILKSKGLQQSNYQYCKIVEKPYLISLSIGVRLFELTKSLFTPILKINYY